MPLLIVLAGAMFNAVNAYLNARWLTALGPIRSSAWLETTAFVTGAGLFMVGATINIVSDEILLSLRTRGSDGYRTPSGFLYRWLSCPNYLGEIVEWAGWAIATWSMAGASFAIWTAANLIPRARMHHLWYRDRFPAYPRERRALFPGPF
jgi:steroid 5-alpha reductase family enzyme